jgi:MFS family permease
MVAAEEQGGVAMKPPGSRGFRAAPRRVSAASFLFSTSQAFFLLLPVYLQQSGNSPAQISLVAGLLRASSLMARPPGGRLLDHFGRRSVTTAGAGVTIVAILSLFAFPQMGIPFLAMGLLEGIGTSLVDSGLGTLVADLSPLPPGRKVFAIYTAWMSLACALMPGVGEVIARRGGFFSLFGAAAVALTGGLVVLGRAVQEAQGRLPVVARDPAELVPGSGPSRCAGPGGSGRGSLSGIPISLGSSRYNPPWSRWG